MKLKKLNMQFMSIYNAKKSAMHNITRLLNFSENTKVGGISDKLQQLLAF